MKKIITLSILTASILQAAGPTSVERVNWQSDDFNTTKSGSTSNLKYFQFFDMMPDEISMPIFENLNMSTLADKKLIVGYGMVDPEGKNCKFFSKTDTGFANDTTICLPWWRVERTYQKEVLTLQNLVSFFQSMPRPRQPKLVNFCKDWEPSKTYAGGIVTCTTYYDKFKSAECYDNPVQNSCKVNNCGQYLERDCTITEAVRPPEGHTTLWGAEYEQGKAEPNVKVDSKVDLMTKQYSCPAGKIIPYTSCLNEQTAMMYPYECKADDPATPRDDGEYIYCDENNPTYDTSGNIVGFIGKCASGSAALCQVDTISETKKVCTAPVYKTETLTTDKSVQVTRTFKDKMIDVYSGQPDIYSSDPNCVRANTVEEAREGVYTSPVSGSGRLDDDIYVFRHRSDGTHFKVYCNMQHSRNSSSKKLFPGDLIDDAGNDISDLMQCIPNSGNYSFSGSINIRAADIVTVQQATENEDAAPTHMYARTHFSSSEVAIAGITVTPATYVSSFPKYPNWAGAHLALLDNSLGSLGIMFPFAGAYELYFYNKNDEEVAIANLDISDFQSMGNGYIPLALATKTTYPEGLGSGVTEAKACLDDPFVEWGGGVYGGKHNIKNETCDSPDTPFVKSKAVYKVIVKDLLTGQVTPIPLVYPLAYPNRVFASKLKIMEHRKYRCYDPFQLPMPPS